MKYEIGPLFLPAGSIRGLLALLVVGALPFLAWQGIVVDQFYQLAAMAIIGYLFGSSQQKPNAGNEGASEELENMKDALVKLQEESQLQKLQIMQQGGVIVSPAEKK
jgi:hypothetical protein